MFLSRYKMRILFIEYILFSYEEYPTTNSYEEFYKADNEQENTYVQIYYICSTVT